jgi:hypothetical protein
MVIHPVCAALDGHGCTRAVVQGLLPAAPFFSLEGPCPGARLKPFRLSVEGDRLQVSLLG